MSATQEGWNTAGSPKLDLDRLCRRMKQRTPAFARTSHFFKKVLQIEEVVIIVKIQGAERVSNSFIFPTRNVDEFLEFDGPTSLLSVCAFLFVASFSFCLSQVIIED